MATFIEKNKRKGALAALLLLFKGRKSHLALLLLMVLMMFMFVLPRNAMSLFFAGVAKLPGGAAIVRHFNGPDNDFSALIAAFRAAKNQRNNAGAWGVFFDADAAKRGRKTTGSSIDMIKGGKDDMASSADLANKVKGGETIGGVLTPEDAKRRGEGVALGAEDLGGERAQLAAAGGGLLERGLLKLGAGLGAFGFGQAYAGKDMFSTGRGSRGSDPRGAALSSTSAPASSGGGSSRIPGVNGKLAADMAKASRMMHRSASTRVGGTCAGARCAFHQLTAGRTQMMLSRDPVCQPGNGCMPEFARDNAGAPFDGNPIGADAPRILQADAATTPNVDGISTPNVDSPNTGDVTKYIDEANELESDAKACQDYDAAHREEDQRHRNDLQGVGQNAMDRGCEDVDCGSSRSKINACKALKTEGNNACQQVNTDNYNACMGCPLRARQGCDPRPNPECFR